MDPERRVGWKSSGTREASDTIVRMEGVKELGSKPKYWVNVLIKHVHKCSLSSVMRQGVWRGSES